MLIWERKIERGLKVVLNAAPHPVSVARLAGPERGGQHTARGSLDFRTQGVEYFKPCDGKISSDFHERIGYRPSRLLNDDSVSSLICPG
jgi:hypothetical protein